jgi:hypothetical protein
LVAILILTPALMHASFQPAKIYHPVDMQSTEVPESSPLNGIGAYLNPLTTLMIILAAGAVFYLLLSMLTPEGRKQLLTNLALIAVLVFALWYASSRPRPAQIQPTEDINYVNGTSAPVLVTAEPLPEFQAGSPDWLVWGIAGLLGLGVAGFAAFILLKRKPKGPGSPVKQLGDEAEDALNRLNAGEDYEDVIIRCYAQMSKLVADLGVSRSPAVTPHEFIAALTSFGLPEAAVETLTRLFEQVRYGNQPASKDDNEQAKVHLTRILVACQALEQQA